MDPSDSRTIDESVVETDPAARQPGLQLVIAWAFEDPSRVGEVIRVPLGAAVIVGRGPDATRPIRQRPDGEEPRPPLTEARLHREHLAVTRHGARWVTVRRLGKNSVLVDGQPLGEGEARQAAEGALILLSGRVLLMVVADEVPIAPGMPLHPFGDADEHGIVGESPAIWQLRARLRTLGPKRPHVLVRGPSGSGKELVANALHRLSARAQQAFVSRNASTFPEGLMDAELVGNIRNYPNPGMAERTGLLGAAHKGTLFLDEIGELPMALQPKLLRVMDHGEFQRLGEATPTRVDVRVLGATHQEVTALRHDLAARFEMRLDVPSLSERLSDLPMILRHVARQACADDPSLAGQILDERGEPRIRCQLVAWIIRGDLTTNVRAVHERFWRAVAHASSNEPLDRPPPLASASTTSSPSPSPQSTSYRSPRDITRTEVERVLADATSMDDAAARLGVKDRHVLQRLRKRFGLL